VQNVRFTYDCFALLTSLSRSWNSLKEFSLLGIACPMILMGVNCTFALVYQGTEMALPPHQNLRCWQLDQDGSSRTKFQDFSGLAAENLSDAQLA
jgi:hypothetical protein